MLHWGLCWTCRVIAACALDRRFLGGRYGTAGLRYKTGGFAPRFARWLPYRIQVGTCLLVEPARESRVPPAAGLQEHQLHGCLLGVVLEQGESEAQAGCERGRAVLREQGRMQGRGKLAHGAYRLN